MTKKYRTGDEVYIDCDSSMGASSCGFEKIEDLRERFDTITGEKYEQYKVTGDWYDQRTGSCVEGAQAFYLRDASEMHR